MNLWKDDKKGIEYVAHTSPLCMITSCFKYKNCDRVMIKGKKVMCTKYERMTLEKMYKYYKE